MTVPLPDLARATCGHHRGHHGVGLTETWRARTFLHQMHKPQPTSSLCGSWPAACIALTDSLATRGSVRLRIETRQIPQCTQASVWRVYVLIDPGEYCTALVRNLRFLRGTQPSVMAISGILYLNIGTSTYSLLHPTP